jgi:predicted TIM-barrel fold metal-dependent hydrolase
LTGESLVTASWTGAIDCDLHPRVPTPALLARYMDDHWSAAVETRGIDVWDTIAYPANSPLTRRPDWRASQADTDPVKAAQATLDRHGFAHAICNCLLPVQAFRDENLAAAFARAGNDWLAAEWLDKDDRFRGSVLVPLQSPQRAVEEIERRAGDPRFVQVHMLALGEQPLGKPVHWPVYEAAERHGFTLGIHAGSTYHHALTGSGWPSYHLEDYAAQSLGFHTQVGSLVCEGVFVKFPRLKAVLIESGVTWLPPYLWRLSKFWRGARAEVPWIDRPPEEIVREHIRLTTQPFDGPPDGSRGAQHLGRLMDQLGSDEMLLFATDFPHWQFDDDEMLPAGIAPELRRKILIDNPLATYPRLQSPQGNLTRRPT